MALVSAGVWFYFARDEHFRYLHPRETVVATFLLPAAFTMIWIAISGYRDAQWRLPVLSAARRGVIVGVLFGSLFSLPLLKTWAWPAVWGIVTGLPTSDDLGNMAISVIIIIVTFSAIGGAAGGVSGIIRDFFPRWRVLPNRGSK